MEHIVEKLKLGDFERFYEFASDFILNRYFDYPREVRKQYLEKDLGKTELLKDFKKGNTEILVATCKEEIVGF
ncbi:MAG: hypothetical protein ACPLY7_02465, partial [Microgenomates group bacterium]